jgi:hypothetical protein
MAAKRENLVYMVRTTCPWEKLAPTLPSPSVLFLTRV